MKKIFAKFLFMLMVLGGLAFMACEDNSTKPEVDLDNEGRFCDTIAYMYEQNPDSLYIGWELLPIIGERGNWLVPMQSCIGELTNLRFLSMREGVNDSLPDELTNLINLEYLDLYANRIEVLPDSIGKMKSLKYLDLSSNELKELPFSFGYLSELQFLNLGYNNIDAFPQSELLPENRTVD